MTDTPKPLRYADVLRNVGVGIDVLLDSATLEGKALRRLAELCEQAEQHLVAEYPTNTLFNAEAQRLVRDIAAGYQEGVVEEAGASPALTDAVVLLAKAQDRVADWVEGNGNA